MSYICSNPITANAFYVFVNRLILYRKPYILPCFYVSCPLMGQEMKNDGSKKISGNLLRGGEDMRITVKQEWVEEWKQERYKHLLAERERNLAEIKAADIGDLNTLESVGILIEKDIEAIKDAAKIRGVEL